MLSWKLLEKPFLKLKRFFDRTTPTPDHVTNGMVKVTSS
jgi:hypothetical protein